MVENKLPLTAKELEKIIRTYLDWLFKDVDIAAELSKPRFQDRLEKIPEWECPRLVDIFPEEKR